MIIPVNLPMGLRFSSGWLSWVALIFAPTAATAGMLAQIMHIIISFVRGHDYKIFFDHE
jgi:hypothetical protein